MPDPRFAADITDDPRSDAALVRELADLTPAMLWITGRDNLCEWVNRACLDYTGRTLEQERGLGWAEFVHPDDREGCLRAVQQAFDDQAPYELEYRVLRFDGQYRWILDRARPRRAADGSFAGYVGTAFDVSERRVAQEAIARSEARYHAVFDTTLDGILILDDDGRCVELNTAMCRLLRTPRGEMLGRAIPSFVSPARAAQAQRAFAGLLASGTFAGEFALMASDGSEVELEWSSRASFAPGLHLCVARPIAERKRAERATQLLVVAGRLLSSTHDVEDALVRLVHEAVKDLAEVAWVVVRDPHGSARCLASSHHDPRLAAAVRGHVAGRELGVDAPLARPSLDAASLPGAGVVQLLRVPVGAPGALRGELVIGAPDLGEKELLLGEELGRRVHDALEHAQLLREAQEANRLKDEFLATLSHELRTPLNAIVGWSHVLQGGPLDERTITRASEIIARNAQSQVQLISDLLDVSRIAAGKLRLSPGVVDLRAVLEAALDAVKPAFESREHQVVVDVGPGTWPVWADAERLQQVAWNLLSNAAKFTPRGGRIQVSLALDGDHVVLRVLDDGPGIDAAFLPYVFERFRQADSSTTRSHGGLGLGMAIVRHLVEAHGGVVSCANRDDGHSGACFTVRLPQTLPPSAAVPSERRAAAAVSLEGLRVVVVDDEADSREIVCTVLTRQGAEVSEARDAAEAFDLVRRMRPHVLVSDIQMAGEDGHGLMRRVRALPPAEGGLVAAAALSAYAGPEHRAASLAAGFQTHVAKPVPPAELIAVVAGLAGRQIG